MSDVVDRTTVEGAVPAALTALAECARISAACAATMIDLGGMAAETQAALDCADACRFAEAVLARHGAVDAAVVGAGLDAAAAAASASAELCGAHADHHTHCARHSRSAAACVAAIEALPRA